MNAFDETAARFRKTLGARGESPDADYALGVVSAVRGDREGARGFYERTLRAAPEFAAARYGLGIVYAELGRYREAAAELDAARIGLGWTVRIARALGRSFRALGEDERAVDAYRAALAEDRDGELSDL